MQKEAKNKYKECKVEALLWSYPASSKRETKYDGQVEKYFLWTPIVQELLPSSKDWDFANSSWTEHEGPGPGWGEGEAHKTLGTPEWNLIESGSVPRSLSQKGQDLDPQILDSRLLITGSHGNGSLPELS